MCAVNTYGDVAPGHPFEFSQTENYWPAARDVNDFNLGRHILMGQSELS